jgi:phosphate transport system permease protein
MSITTLIALVLVAMIAAFVMGRGRSRVLANATGRGVRSLNSLPFYYGMLTALWCGTPALLLLMGWLAFDDSIVRAIIVDGLPLAQQQLPEAQLSLLLSTVENIASGSYPDSKQLVYLQNAAEQLLALRATSQDLLALVLFCTAIIGATIGWLKVSPKYRARVKVEAAFKWVLMACSMIAILTTVGIILSVIFESVHFFKQVPITEFLFGTHWSPQVAIRADQVGSSGAFGAVPLFVGTLLISFIAMSVAIPVGLMSAIYLSEYAGPKFRTWVKPALEILAGIPTVVYGFFAVVTVAPFIKGSFAPLLGLDASSESALAAGLVMGVMIIPFVSSLSDDVINAVPQTLRDGSLALGATRSETIKLVVFPAALPGIVGGVLLAVSRAIGETMIVVMAAGLSANLTINPMESVTTVTVQIVTLLVGDQEFDSAKTLSAFALGLMLFVVTLALNFYALYVVRKYSEQYE